jgi:hypothetical protein
MGPGEKKYDSFSDGVTFPQPGSPISETAEVTGTPAADGSVIPGTSPVSDSDPSGLKGTTIAASIDITKYSCPAGSDCSTGIPSGCDDNNLTGLAGSAAMYCYVIENTSPTQQLCEVDMTDPAIGYSKSLGCMGPGEKKYGSFSNGVTFPQPGSPISETAEVTGKPATNGSVIPSASPVSASDPSGLQGTTPPPPPPADGGASGDPHIKSWNGENYDFHGVCDLVLLKNHGFNNGVGMDIQIRTKKTRQWSYVSSAVLRIGDESFEVAGGKDMQYWVNGVAGDDLTDNGMLSKTISGYPINFSQLNSKQREFAVALGNGEAVVFKTWNEFVRVDIQGATDADFKGSVGLMGSFPEGIKIGRDGKTVIDDLNEFGLEWQVDATEPKLFHNLEGPQFPERCVIPSAAEMRRRLGESTITQEQAEKACGRVSEADRSLCIFDVMATNDMDVAGAY